MAPTEEAVLRLYEAVKQNRPGEAAECYCDDATYRDIAFDLKGKDDIAAMWRLVCSNGVKVQYMGIRTEGSGVKGYWLFDYVFTETGNKVHNLMDSTFILRDGKILVHQDRTSRWIWAKQALGVPKGLLVTMLPFILRMQAKAKLEKFKANEPRPI